MPFYQYFCKNCECQFKTYHGADEKANNCPNCQSIEIKKTISMPSLQVKAEKNNTAGQRVEKFIEESRQLLQEQKRDIETDYKP